MKLKPITLTSANAWRLQKERCAVYEETLTLVKSENGLRYESHLRKTQVVYSPDISYSETWRIWMMRPTDAERCTEWQHNRWAGKTVPVDIV